MVSRIQKKKKLIVPNKNYEDDSYTSKDGTQTNPEGSSRLIDASLLLPDDSQPNTADPSSVKSTKRHLSTRNLNKVSNQKPK